MMRIRRGFTLIELLTVMAMSAILLGLIIIPLVQSFNLTREAQAFADAQDHARVLSERIAKEIGNSYSVRSGSMFVTTVNGTQKRVAPGTQIVTLLKPTGGMVEIPVSNTKLDLVLPAEGSQSEVATGVFTNPNGMVDPTLQSPRGQVVLPVGPGFTMVRYCIGRRDPMKEYNNPYDGLLMVRNGAQDNLYVLYRIEVQPMVRRAGVGSNGDTSVRWRPNLNFFQSDAETDMIPIDIDDPKFLEPSRVVGTNEIITTDAKADRIKAWLGRAIIQTEFSRYDMIEPIYDLRTRQVSLEPGTDTPRIFPLVQFRPERISNDPATGHSAVRVSEESDSAEASGPDVFTTQYGQWASVVVRTYPRGWDPVPPHNLYEVGYTTDHAGDAGFAPGYSIYGYDHGTTSDTDITNLRSHELFDVMTYLRLASVKGAVANDQIYPFSSAVAAANGRSNFLGSNDWDSVFTPYSVDAARGRVKASFSIEEVGNPSVVPSTPNNLPYAPTSNINPIDAGAPYTPGNDPKNALTLPFDDPQFRSINDLFDYVYTRYPQLTDGRVHRFIDLRTLPCSDGTPSPLFPSRVTNQPTGFTYDAVDGSRRNRVQIVPGSEVIVGPDQLPGPHQGRPIRYSRTTGEPGPNQYRINYADLTEPTDSTGQTTAQVYRDQFELSAADVTGFDPKVYDPGNFASAVIQPRFKVGYVEFNSDPNVPLPFNTTTGADITTQGFLISYRFQYTGTLAVPPMIGGRTKVDSFAVDYDSRELLSVLLTIRNYPQSSLPNPQNVTLKSTAKVRNYSR